MGSEAGQPGGSDAKPFESAGAARNPCGVRRRARIGYGVAALAAAALLLVPALLLLHPWARPARTGQRALARIPLPLSPLPTPAPAPRAPGSGKRPSDVAIRVPMGAGPTGVAYGHGRLWVTRDDGTVARLQPRSGAVVGVTRVGRFPLRMAMTREAVWVVDEGTGMLSRLDVRSGRVRARVRVCALPSGVAATPTAVWVVCALGQLVRVDARTEQVTARTDPGPAAADPPDLAAGRDGVWVAGLDRVIRLDPATGAITATVAVPSPADVAVRADTVWVASFRANSVARIDARSAMVTGRFPVGRNPSGVTLTPGRVWVVNDGDSTVSKLDARSGRTLATIRVGAYSYDITSGRGGVWAQSYGAQSLFHIRPRRGAAADIPPDAPLT